jgi:mannose/fructose-specific phosphotransferase system component IIA
MGHKTGVVIVTHGSVGQTMVDEAERVLGTLNVIAVSIAFGEGQASIQTRLDAALSGSGVEIEDVLFLTDLEGSTPNNLCCRRCHGHSVVLSGVNLPMLFKLATADRSHGAAALADELQKTGLKSIHIRVPGSNS